MSVWVGFLYTEISRVLLCPGKTRVQEGDGAITVGKLCGQLNMWVNGISMLKELLAVFCLLHDKSVIHIPEPKPVWIGGSGNGFGFKVFHK